MNNGELNKSIKKYLESTQIAFEHDEYDIRFIEKLCNDEDIEIPEAVSRWKVLAEERMDKDLTRLVMGCIYED